MKNIPTRKISETILEFAEPLLRELPDRYSKDALKGIIRLATCVWNACVLDQWNDTIEYTDLLKRPFEEKGFVRELMTINTLIDRKRNFYNDDPRGITNARIIVRNGKFSLRAETRLDFNKIKYRGLVN